MRVSFYLLKIEAVAPEVVHQNRLVTYDDKQNETQGVAFHEVFTVVEQDIVLLWHVVYGAGNLILAATLRSNLNGTEPIAAIF